MASALRLADELGPDSLSVEAIARAVGLTQPGVFRHSGNMGGGHSYDHRQDD